MKIPQDMMPGTVHKTNNYGDLVVIEYNGCESVKVIFKLTGYIAVTQSDTIRKGRVKDRLKPSVYGVGFIGDGEYQSGTNGELTKAYRTWSNMLRRCYCPKLHKRQPAYIGCSVIDEWHNFQVFAKWFYENYPNDGGDWQLDKDVKVSGNKIYSPDTCMLVTHKENAIEARAKYYKVKSPDGVVTEVYNMREFCRSNGLSHGHMSSIITGKRNQHKGWTRA